LRQVGSFLRDTVSSTNKTDRHDITEIFLNVALNTIDTNHNPTTIICFFGKLRSYHVSIAWMMSSVGFLVLKNIPVTSLRSALWNYSEKTTSLSQVTNKLYHIQWNWVAISTNYIIRCKSNHRTIRSATNFWSSLEWLLVILNKNVKSNKVQIWIVFSMPYLRMYFVVSPSTKDLIHIKSDSDKCGIFNLNPISSSAVKVSLLSSSPLQLPCKELGNTQFASEINVENKCLQGSGNWYFLYRMVYWELSIVFFYYGDQYTTK